MQKILIATQNPGKFKEFEAELKDQALELVNLKDVKLHKLNVEEPYATTWENALHKAKTYAEKSGLIAVADDSGLFITALGGKPGVATKRAASTPEKRIKKILDQLRNVPTSKRNAYMEASGCLYDPKTKSFTIFEGRVNGRITNATGTESRDGMEHDAIFYYPPLKKLFSDLSPEEKNLVSHRGQIIRQIKYFLAHQFDFKQFIVPVGMVFKDKKLLLLQRRDGRPDFNGKWEFPGGGVQNNENLEECVTRECYEETGFKVEIVERLPKIPSLVMSSPAYKVFLVPFVCRIQSGDLKIADGESLDSGWFSLEELNRVELLPLNKKCIQDNLNVLKKYFV